MSSRILTERFNIYCNHERSYKSFENSIYYVFFESSETDFEYIKQAERLYYKLIESLVDYDKSIVKSLREIDKYHMIREFSHILAPKNNIVSMNNREIKNDEYNSIFNELVNYIADDLVSMNTSFKKDVLNSLYIGDVRSAYELIRTYYDNELNFKFLDGASSNYKKRFLKRLYRLIIDNEFKDYVKDKHED